MIIKQYLPFRASREGWIPDRLYVQFIPQDATQLSEELTRRTKTVHYHLSNDGTVTALTPLSAAATYLNQTEDTEDSPAKRGILVMIQGEKITEEQREPLLRLLKGIQKEILRIYGEAFPFCRERIRSDRELSPEILELGYLEPKNPLLFRVQTGNYRTRKDAEDSVERLQKAGIAAYITEVRCS